MVLNRSRRISIDSPSISLSNSLGISSGLKAFPFLAYWITNPNFPLILEQPHQKGVVLFCPSTHFLLQICCNIFNENILNQKCMPTSWIQLQNTKWISPPFVEIDPSINLIQHSGVYISLQRKRGCFFLIKFDNQSGTPLTNMLCEWEFLPKHGLNLSQYF